MVTVEAAGKSIQCKGWNPSPGFSKDPASTLRLRRRVRGLAPIPQAKERQAFLEISMTVQGRWKVAH